MSIADHAFDRRRPACRSRRHAVGTAVFATLLALAALGLAQEADGGEVGASTYLQCAACHQADGAGIPGAFPPLQGHAADLLAIDGGREYLAKLTIYGLQGPITVDGVAYNGVMNPHAHLSDDALAAVLNYVLHSWGNDDLLSDDAAPFAPAEIAEQRDLGLSPADMLAERETLDLGDD